MHAVYSINALFDQNAIAVYAAFDSSIANIAVARQQLLPPFSYDRMTWIKPSFLWLMYRSNWAQQPGMDRILRIWVGRKEWDNALREAILTTPEPHVYPDAKQWRQFADKARIKVQWDPERDIRNQRLQHKSIQVGITAALSEQYAKQWIRRIEDLTPLTHQIRNLVFQGKYNAAEALLPAENAYPVDAKMAKALGM